MTVVVVVVVVVDVVCFGRVVELVLVLGSVVVLLGKVWLCVDVVVLIKPPKASQDTRDIINVAINKKISIFFISFLPSF